MNGVTRPVFIQEHTRSGGRIAHRRGLSGSNVIAIACNKSPAAPLKNTINEKRHGALWENRYHATAIEVGKYLQRCLVYIDLNMVRAGVGVVLIVFWGNENCQGREITARRGQIPKP